MKLSDAKYGILLTIPGLVMLFLIVLFPFFYVLYVSFTNYGYGALSGIKIVGLKNYVRIFNDPLFVSSIKKAAVFCFGSTGITYAIGMIAALSLYRITRGATFFRSLVILPWAVPLILSGFIWAWMFNPGYGIVGYMLQSLGMVHGTFNIFADPMLAMVGVIIADAWTRIPFMTVLLLGALEAIPSEIFDATLVDGADGINRVRYIYFPLTLPSAIAGLFITAIFSFRTIDVIFAMTQGGPAKATYVIGYYILDHIYNFMDYSGGAAAGMVLFVIQIGFGAFFYFLLKRVII